MRIGKAASNILKRSVLRPIRPRRPEILSGAVYGQGGSVYAAEGKPLVLSHAVCEADSCISLTCGFYKAVNDLAAKLAEPCGLEVTLLLPETLEESKLKEIMVILEKLSAQEKMEIAGGHTMVTESVTKPMAALTAVGYGVNGISYKAKPDQTLILTKWIALEGTGILANTEAETLSRRYSADFLYPAKAMLQKISALPEAAVAGKHGVTAMHNLSEGGVLGALYELAEGSGVGLEVDLKAIPIRQETVEICEYFHKNPYQFASNGSMLMACDDGEKVLLALEEAGIPASVIGRTTDGNDRILHNEEDVRYLDRPGMDEIWNR